MSAAIVWRLGEFSPVGAAPRSPPWIHKSHSRHSGRYSWDWWHVQAGHWNDKSLSLNETGARWSCRVCPIKMALEFLGGTELFQVVEAPEVKYK